ncbi:MAG TPA: 3-isopropylmalate dehydratase, partial [Burkholderiaceae bacterium]|nr:3-isopropylmalate dehydratase [Burkholderiaceae bacterium]
MSTDEISPLPAMVHFDAMLGRHPYTGFETGGEHPIGRDAVRAARIEVVVADSSREHSVVAEQAAGVRLVIAESFERTYRQNADNLGLLTSTDLGLVERIRRGEAIARDELLAGRDALAAAIVRAGGLIAYGQQRLPRRPSLRGAASDDAPGPRTLFQKIVDRHTLA